MDKQPIFFLTFCLLLHFVPFSAANCQEYSWKHYSIADGLPQTQVMNLFQDSKGYIWIGTKGGFSKFDGVEFENYTLKDNLEDEYVDYFFEDAAGRIYVGSGYGISYMDKGKLNPIAVPKYPGRSKYFVDNQQRIWIFPLDRKIVCTEDGEILLAHPLDHLINHNETGIIRQDSHTGNIFIKTSDGKLIIWDGKKAEMLESRRAFKGIIIGNAGSTYAVSRESIFSFETSKILPTKFDLEKFDIVGFNSGQDMYLHKKDDYSILWHYDGKQLKEFKNDFNMIVSLLVDDQENLWVGTESGLWRLESKGFQNYLAGPDNNFYTWNVLQDKNEKIWFASFHHGLKRLEGDEFIDVPIKHLFNAFSPRTGKNEWQYFYPGGVKDTQGDLYFSTYQGVLKYDGLNFDWYHSRYPETIMYIYEDKQEDKLLLASAHNGVVEIGRDRKPHYDSERGSREHTGLITSILKDKYDRIWICGSQGVSIKEEGLWRNLPDERDSISIGAISMYKDHKENLWLGSLDGLYFYDYNKLRKVGISVFDRQVGVLNMTNDQELLIGSIAGIGLLDLNDFYSTGSESIRYFDSHNGFLGAECKHNSSFKDDEGNIWICTSDRVVKVIPEKIQSNPYPPRVYVEGVSIINDKMEWEAVFNEYDTGNGYKLEPGFEDVRFDYHGISHLAPLGVKYQTILEGYDEKWSAITSERYRTYTNLPAGDYIFKVKASNNDGIWSENLAEVNISRMPVWHEITAIRLAGLLGLILFAAVAGYLYSSSQKRKRDQTIENDLKISKLQFKSLQGLVNPHFTFNAINSIASMVYRENRDEAYHYFTKFSKLIRAAFDHSEETTRSIRDEMNFVKNYLDIEKMRFKDRFDFQISVDKKVNLDWRIPKMVVQIYVENAIKHGLIHKEINGFLEIRISLRTDYLNILVKDNGIGRSQSNGHKDQGTSLGQGTRIMLEYFDLLNRFNTQKISSKTFDLLNSDGSSSGTEVVVSIPLRFKYSI